MLSPYITTPYLLHLYNTKTNLVHYHVTVQP